MFKPLIPGRVSPKTRPMHNSQYSQAKELQSLLLKDAADPDLKPAVRAQIARAFKELGEFRLRLQMKGPPKAVDAAALKKPKANSRGPGFAEG